MLLKVVCQEQDWTFKRPLSMLCLERITRRLEQIFPNLPQNYSLQYEDLDGDMIDVTCDADLKTLIECTFDAQSITLFVQETPMNQQPVFVKGNQKDRKQQRKKKVKKMINKTIQKMLPSIVEQVRSSIINPKQDDLVISELIPQTAKMTLEEKPIHKLVRCDGCEVCPLVGIRYKCAICEDFDFCEKCEEQNPHQHPFLKIRTPEQAPSIIFAAIGDKPDLALGNLIRKQLPQFIHDLQMKSGNQIVDSIFERGTQETPTEQQQIPTQLNESTQLNQTTQLSEKQTIVLELCEILQVNPQVIQRIVEIFEGLSTQEILKIICEDENFLSGLQQSKI